MGLINVVKPLLSTALNTVLSINLGKTKNHFSSEEILGKPGIEPGAAGVRSENAIHVLKVHKCTLIVLYEMK